MKGKKNHEIVILPERCKECGICMEFCPKKVLAAGEDDKPVVADRKSCRACRMCEYRCPDFAIRIESGDEYHHA